MKKAFLNLIVILFLVLAFFGNETLFARAVQPPFLDAQSAIILDFNSGRVLYNKNSFAKLPPASTVKVMTAVIALERLPLDRPVAVSRLAFNASPSRAGLTCFATYKARDLIIATLVSSSNDAAIALAEAVSGDQENFAQLMNAKAKSLGMVNTNFINATGLPDKQNKEQYTTAYDLARFMQYAARDKRIDQIMGIMTTAISGSDGRHILLKSHNKMLWLTPKYVKGKTGWTMASKHTFVGTDYSENKKIAFALLGSKKPWTDIERLASFGYLVQANN